MGITHRNDCPVSSEPFYLVVEKVKTEPYWMHYLTIEELNNVLFFKNKNEAIEAAKEQAKRTRNIQLLFVVNAYGKVEPQEPIVTEFKPEAKQNKVKLDTDIEPLDFPK